MGALFALVVDDDDIVRTSLLRLLETTGDVVVATASDVEGARAMLDEARYDGVISDLSFPGDSRGGLRVLERVRRVDELRAGGLTELLLFTGTEDITAANDAEALGARFLHKPFEPRAIARFVHRMRARAELSEIAAEEVVRVAEMADLPKRVVEVLVLVVAQTSTKEICAVMGISTDTLKTYVARMIRDLRRAVGIHASNRRDVALAVLGRVVGFEASLALAERRRGRGAKG